MEIAIKHVSVISRFILKVSLALVGAMCLTGCASTVVEKTSYSSGDPDVVCKPKYTQVYQSALKIGGAGRIVQIPSGEVCAIGSLQKKERVHFSFNQVDNQLKGSNISTASFYACIEVEATDLQTAYISDCLGVDVLPGIIKDKSAIHNIEQYFTATGEDYYEANAYLHGKLRRDKKCESLIYDSSRVPVDQTGEIEVPYLSGRCGKIGPVFMEIKSIRVE